MAHPLASSSLLARECLIDGAWVGADSGAVFPVFDPATGAEITRVSDMGAAETRRAIGAAHAAFTGWNRTTAARRADILRRWHGLILENREALARLMTAEQGKPMAEADAEVAYGASFVLWFAEEARRVYGETIPAPGSDRRILALKQPIGVAAVITPWNFPIAMLTRKLAPALAAGCTTVVKPAEETPLSALALCLLAEKAGFPRGVVNIVTAADPEPVGLELTANPLVRKLSFTGSTAVGKKLMAMSAPTVKKLSLELGGNAPFIVFDDADLEAAVQGAVASKYRNSGQTCICANRFLVQDGVYEEFAARLAEAAAGLKVAPGTEEGSRQGPLINDAALAKVERLLQDARDKGARILTGGSRHTLGGNFFQPTVLADVTPEMACVNEEIFGPLAPIMRFFDEEEAIRLANSTPYGLAAYFYARDLGRVWRVAERLEFGIVGVNEGLVSTEVAPFGGMKESGLGREGSRHGIDEYLEIKYLCLGGIDG